MNAGDSGDERLNECLNHLNVEKTSLFNIRSSLAGGQLALI